MRGRKKKALKEISMKLVLLISALLVGCASSDIRNWNTNTQTGQIVLYTGESMLSMPTMNDAQKRLKESGKCPNDYDVKEIGWQGGSVPVSNSVSESKVTTTSSINIGGQDMLAIEQSKGSSTGDNTVIKIENYQTTKTDDGKGTTIVRSPRKAQASQGMRGLWFDFKCK